MLASPLSTVTSYKVALLGGEDGVRDASGIELLFDITWTFTTAVTDPYGDGPGGPILVLTDDAEPFSRYYAEILLTEGLNTFAIRDVATLTPSLLGSYEVVVLGAVPLTTAQATLLADWVNAGGNLIAMRPDPDLAGLLGLVNTGATLSEGYLLVNTTDRTRRWGSSTRPFSPMAPPISIPLTDAETLATVFRQRHHGDSLSSCHPPQCRFERRQGCRIRVRSRAIDCLHAPGQPRLDRSGTRRHPAAAVQRPVLWPGQLRSAAELDRFLKGRHPTGRRTTTSAREHDNLHERGSHAAAALLVPAARVKGRCRHDRR